MKMTRYVSFRSQAAGRMLAVFAGLAALAAAGCDRPTASAVERSATPAADAELPEVLATVDGEEIRLGDLPARVSEQLTQLQNSYRQQRYAVLEEALDRMLSDRMLAAEAEKRGVSVAELVAAESGVLLEPTDADIEAWYAENRARLQGRTLDQLREQIRNHLRTEREGEAGEAFNRRLRSDYEVEVFLDPFRVSLDNAGAPTLGPPDAAVTLVEFSDFECPFCSRFFPTLKRVEAEYGDRVNIVYRQFPIPSLHPKAFKAAEASLCAHEQDAFWAYHDVLFQEQDRLTVRDLKEKAGRLGLKQSDFDQCLDTGRYVEWVENDQAAGQAAGVSGTPALFVNGIPIPGGAVAYDVVAEALDAELERAAAN